jgi:hypothetical protein
MPASTDLEPSGDAPTRLTPRARRGVRQFGRIEKAPLNRARHAMHRALAGLVASLRARPRPRGGIGRAGAVRSAPPVVSSRSISSVVRLRAWAAPDGRATLCAHRTNSSSCSRQAMRWTSMAFRSAIFSRSIRPRKDANRPSNCTAGTSDTAIGCSKRHTRSRTWCARSAAGT